MLECLDNARIHLRLTLDEARQALSDLRHDAFDDGLSGALKELARTAGEKGVAVTIEEDGSPPALPASTNRALLLVAREAIRNALAHGSPAAIRVCLTVRPGELRLEVQDDGCGFEALPTISPRPGISEFLVCGSGWSRSPAPSK